MQPLRTARVSGASQVLGLGPATKASHKSRDKTDTDSTSRRAAAHGVQNSRVRMPRQDSAISQGFIGSVLGNDSAGNSARKPGAGRRFGNASPSRTRPVPKSVYLVRRVVVAVVALVVVVAIVLGCRAVISAVGHHNDLASGQNSSQAAKKQKRTNPSKDTGRRKPPKPDTSKASGQEALTDHSRAVIAAAAQKTAAASGKQVRQYSYCVSGKGDVGDAGVIQSFENVVFRTLNDPRGWPRAGATFTYNADSSHCDFTVYLAQASQMQTFSANCSNSYSCCVGDNVIINQDRYNEATPQLLSAGMSLDRYREMVINHETGHRLGHLDNQPSCPASGSPAPLMQEQSMSLRGCTPNEWPLDSELWVK
ncbi:DUF3152 domain-containing protein [Bifidobacterium sp. ESL0798]|uniref:DUF3152 domain-containing protein n=1 Tax=Bifidobacterium sp. ESL0798 TaxID=2983235 RepID=UPI0023F94238|nr:DUF3152 domain-containing protein [Bifidobacterium sp. ESL0798]WEV74199.1 DUF3152 domain-containing protein [Bifidobacterium sp. ESL0798]